MDDQVGSFSSRSSHNLSWPSYIKNAKFYWMAFLIFILGELISFLFFHLRQNWEMVRLQTEFNRLADLRLFLIEERIQSTLNQIDYIKQFYYASKEVTEQQFITFTKHSLNVNPNLIALGWIDKEEIQTNRFINKRPAIPSLYVANLDKSHLDPSSYIHLAYLQESFPDFPIYIDEAFVPNFLQGLYSSLSSNSPQVSDATTILHDTKEKAFFIFSAIFHKAPELVKGKDLLQNTRGVIVSISDIESLIQDFRENIELAGISLAIYDESKGNSLIYSFDPSSKESPSVPTAKEQALQNKWARDRLIHLGDRIWRAQAIPTVSFIKRRSNTLPWLILIGGFIISSLTAGYFLALVNRRLLIEEEVWKRTEELAEMNQTLQQEIQERKRIEEDFTKKQRYLQRRHEALEYLTKFTTSELKSGFQEVVLRTALVMQIDRVSIWLYETIDQTNYLVCASLYNATTNTFSEHLEMKLNTIPHYFQALTSNSHVILPSTNPNLNHEMLPYLSSFHIVSKLDIPIVFEGHFLGVLCCEETRTPRSWQLEDRHFGQTIADIIALIIEQANRRRAEKALQESEERFRYVTQNAVDAIISVTEKGEIIAWNYGAEQMFGYPEIEMLGKDLSYILSDKDRNSPLVSSKPIEMEAFHKEGYSFPVEVSHTRWKSGARYFDTIIIRDVTERKEYEKRIITAMKEAKAANEAKSEFLATVSHELRTPLNAIIGFNQCLLLGMDGLINDRQKVSLKKIEKSSFHLLNLINDILDLAKIEAQKMELDRSLNNLTDILLSCVEEMQPLAKQKQLPLYLKVDRHPLMIRVDKLRIRQVILNLLSNAIKFTEKGSIEVELVNTQDWVYIHVKDTGIGLSEQEMEKIFKPFSQADSSITRKYGGTGLGLVISKKIVELHGGKLLAESKKSQGSTFTVSLPKKLDEISKSRLPEVR